jgi:hypothetical protein
MCLTSNHCTLKPTRSLKSMFRIHYMSLMTSIQGSVLLCTPIKTLTASTQRRTGQKSLLKSIQKPEMVSLHRTVAMTHQHNRLWCQTQRGLLCIDTSRDHRFGLLSCTTVKATLTSTIGLLTALSKLSLAGQKRE